MNCPKCASEKVVRSSQSWTNLQGERIAKHYVDCNSCGYSVSGSKLEELLEEFKTKKVLLSELVNEVEEYWTAPKGLPEIGVHAITHPKSYIEFYNILFGMTLVYKKLGYEIIQDVNI